MPESKSRRIKYLQQPNKQNNNKNNGRGFYLNCCCLWITALFFLPVHQGCTATRGRPIPAAVPPASTFRALMASGKSKRGNRPKMGAIAASGRAGDRYSKPRSANDSGCSRPATMK